MFGTSFKLTNPRLNSSHTAMPMSNCFSMEKNDLYTLHYFATHVYKLNICIEVVSTYILTGSEILKKHVDFEQKFGLIPAAIRLGLSDRHG